MTDYTDDRPGVYGLDADALAAVAGGSGASLDPSG
jgi:hypothetical protein